MAENQNNMMNKKIEDAILVWEFISKDKNQRRLQNKSLSNLTTSIAYGRLADLLRLIKDVKVLDILDKKWKSDVMYMVNDLRQFSFEGMWLDSIEKLFVNNLHNDINSLVKLEDYENQLCKEYRVMNKHVMNLTCKLKEAEADVAAITYRKTKTMSSYTSRIIEIQNIRQMMETFIQRCENIKVEIEQISMMMKVVLAARTKLDALEVDFSSTTLFRNKIE